MKKTFDCVEMKTQIQEKLWIEAGETFEGLLQLLDKKRDKNDLLLRLKEKQEKDKKLVLV